MASHNQHTDNAKRYQSRIKREMYANRLNPFNSPPSSTGTHGTISDTTGELTQNLSNFSFNPDDEGTRKLSEEINNNLPRKPTGTTGRFGTRPITNLNHLQNINTSALARAFPEWGTVTNTKDINSNSNPRPAAKASVKFSAKAASITIDDDTKENIPPPSEDTVPVKYLHTRRPRTIAEMQPRVETLSESSTVLSRTPTQPIPPSRRSRFAKVAKQQSPGSPVHSTRRPSIQDLVSKVRSTQPPTDKESEKPRALAEAQQLQQQQKYVSHSPINKSSLTGRSFILPPLDHLVDLTSGTLKFSTLRNGVPVFVKHGKARTRFEQPANQHDTVDAVEIPEEDQEIFVSMDKIREEVQELQEHDQMVQREAEKLQLEVNRLQSELKRFKQRKHSDSAFGSGSESEQSINRALDAQRDREYSSNSSLTSLSDLDPVYDEKIAQLQSRLEQASRQVGVNDIHSAALTAERDEALHQASQAREKAKKLQAELESSQKDLDTTQRYRLDKENLENQNSSLRSANDNLRERNIVLSTDLRLKTAELNSVRHELASVNEEMQSLRKVYEALVEEKDMLAQDHASMERQNDSFFKENKCLRSKIDLDGRRISDLEQSISRRDQLINELQSNMTQTTEPAGVREEYAELLSKVKKLTEQHATEHKKKDEVIRAKDSIIKSQSEHLSRLQEQLGDGLIQQREVNEQQREIIKLKDEICGLRRDEATWKREQIKYARMSRSEFTMQHDLENRRQQQQQWAEEKLTMQRTIEHLRSVLKSVRQANKQVADLNLTNTTNLTAQSGKYPRIQSAKYAASEHSAKTEALNVQDDPTRQVDMTEQSDFLSVLTGQPVVELKEVNDQPQLRKQTVDHDAEDVSPGNTVQTIDADLPSLAGPVHRRSRSDDTLTLKQKQPAGILKKSSKFAQDDNTTGALSVQSAHSGISLRSQISARSYRSPTENMTSAFIIPDITIEQRKRSTSQAFRQEMEERRARIEEGTSRILETANAFREELRSARSRSRSRERRAATLSKEAVSVLDSICRHKTANCTVCSRMTPRTSTQAAKTPSEKVKKQVTVRRPIPVSDRTQQPAEEYTEEPTMRPSMPPGDALAIVIKELNDEVKHLEMRMQAKMIELFQLDKATQQRKRKLLTIEYSKMQAEYDAKGKQIYKLHDVLEGQKRAGQLMTQEEMDVTVASILGNDFTQTQTQESKAQSKDEWDGFDSSAFD